MTLRRLYHHKTPHNNQVTSKPGLVLQSLIHLTRALPDPLHTKVIRLNSVSPRQILGVCQHFLLSISTQVPHSSSNGSNNLRQYKRSPNLNFHHLPT